jgi:hypothetical protein
MLIACCLIVALCITTPLGAAETKVKTPVETQVFRYACIDDTGQTTGNIEMRITPNPDGDMEIISTDTFGTHEYAKLNAEMLQTEVRIESTAGKWIGLKRAADGSTWETDGTSKGSYSCKGNARLSDRSLFLLLPTLFDSLGIGEEARFTLVRTESGQRTAMRLRVEEIVEAPIVNRTMENAYRISMELADPSGRLFWPHTYNYYYRVHDLRFLAYDGPDEHKRNSRIVLIEAEQ